MCKKRILVILLLTIPVLSFAEVSIGLNFNVVSPQLEFKENLDRLGYGIAFDVITNRSNSPLRIGASLGFGVYGSQTRQEPFSTTIPDVTVDVTTTNNILFGHLMMQIKLSHGFIQPYVEGLWGFHYLFTDTKIEDVDNEFEEVASSTNLSDFTSSYGLGSGLMFRLMDNINFDSRRDQRGSLYLDCKVRYLVGGEAEYLKEGSIRRENGKVTYDKIKSSTELMTFHIGLVLEF